MHRVLGLNLIKITRMTNVEVREVRVVVAGPAVVDVGGEGGVLPSS